MKKYYCKDCKKEVSWASHNGGKRCHRCAKLKQRKGKIVKCDTCGKEIYRRLSRLRYKIYFCSLKCSYKSFNNRKHIGKLNKIKQEYRYYKKFLNKIKSEYLIWFAGFWEGEGNIKIFNKMSSILSVSQKDDTPLKFILKILKIGRIKKYNSCNVFSIGKTGYIWALVESIKSYLHSHKRILEINNLLKKLKCL